VLAAWHYDLCRFSILFDFSCPIKALLDTSPEALLSSFFLFSHLAKRLDMLQGALTDGSVFYSSYDNGDPYEFALGNRQKINGYAPFL
jgi:hypothetical protein